MRKVNEAGIRLIEDFEGLILEPYLDAVGIPTVGYGTIKYPDGRSVSMKDKPITREQATEYLMHEVNEKASAVESMVKVPLNDNEFAALVCFAYNVGVGALSKSTLLKLLNSKTSKADVADQFLRWNKAGGKELPGLTRRRQAEKSLFLQPTSNLPDIPSKEEIEAKLKSVEDFIKKS